MKCAKTLSWVVSLVVVLGFTSSVLAQGAGGARFSRSWQGYSSYYGSSWLLRSESVQKELELVDDQKTKLQEISDQTRTKTRELYAGVRDLSREEQQKKYAELREKSQELSKDAAKQVEELLLPNQRDRLKQILLQMQMRRGGTVSSLTSEAVVKALDITDEQRTKLREKEQEVLKELEEKTRQLREAARQKLLDTLTPQQREKLKALTGEAFDTQSIYGSRFRGSVRRASRQE